MIDVNTSHVANFIQLTVAPVFLLSAVASILVLLTTRLGRIVDRARVLEAELPGLAPPARALALTELEGLERRSRLVQWALTLGTACAPLICLLITCAFLGLVLHVRFAPVVALLFIATMGVFTAALLVFLREVFVAMATLRIGFPLAAHLPTARLGRTATLAGGGGADRDAAG